MTEIPTMIYGRATVEILDSVTPHNEAQIVERDPELARLAWIRYEVFSFVKCRSGYAYDIVNGAGSWVPTCNARNYERLS